MTKVCTKCGFSKPVTEFSKAAKSHDGLRSNCKACAKQYGAAWRSANPEKIKADKAADYAANKCKRSAAQAVWAKANAERKKATNAAHRTANKARKALTDAERYKSNPEKIKARVVEWRKENNDAHRINNQNRRSRKREAGGKLSKGLFERLFNLQRGKCACGCKQSLGTDYHLDHIMPLALGGLNTDDNIQILRSTCNQQKHAKHPVDFMQQRGYLL